MSAGGSGFRGGRVQRVIFSSIEKTVTMLSLLEENRATFDLVERLYELFQEGVMCMDKDLPRPSPRQVSHTHIYVTPHPSHGNHFHSVLRD